MTEPSSSSFTHPETGELLDSQEDFLAALMAIEERMGYLFELRWKIREGGGESLPPAHQPAPRYRTEKQDRVARCPRCGGKLENERN